MDASQELNACEYLVYIMLLVDRINSYSLLKFLGKTLCSSFIQGCSLLNCLLWTKKQRAWLDNGRRSAKQSILNTSYVIRSIWSPWSLTLCWCFCGHYITWQKGLCQCDEGYSSVYLEIGKSIWIFGGPCVITWAPRSGRRAERDGREVREIWNTRNH